jgi:hypothetical protein
MFLIKNIFNFNETKPTFFNSNWYKSIYGADKNYYFFNVKGRHLGHDPVPEISVVNTRIFNPVEVFPHHVLLHIGQDNFLFSKSDYNFIRDSNLLPRQQDIISKISNDEYIRQFSYPGDNFIYNFKDVNFNQNFPLLILDNFDENNLTTFFDSFDYGSEINIIIYTGRDIGQKFIKKSKNLQIFKGNTSSFNSYLYTLTKYLSFEYTIYLNNGTLFDPTWLKSTLVRISKDNSLEMILPVVQVDSRLLIGFRLTRRGFLIPIHISGNNSINYEDLIPISSGLVLSRRVLSKLFENEGVKFDLIFNEYNLTNINCPIYSDYVLEPNLETGMSYFHKPFELRTNYDRVFFVNNKSNILHNYPEEKLGYYNFFSKSPSLSRPIVLFVDEVKIVNKLNELKNIFESAGFFVLNISQLSKIFYLDTKVVTNLMSLDDLFRQAFSNNLISLIVCTTDYFVNFYEKSDFKAVIDSIPKMYLHFEEDAYSNSLISFDKLDRNSVPDLFKKNRHIYADFYTINSFASNENLQKLTANHLRVWFEQLLGKSSSIRYSGYGE